MVKYDQASRREIIKGLSALGISATSLRYLSDDVIAETHNDEVPFLHSVRLKNPGKAYTNSEHTPPETEKVYRRIGWGRWARIQSRSEAESKVASKIEELSGTNGQVSASVGTRRSNHGVIVRLETIITNEGDVVASPDISEDEVRERLPREVDVTVTDGEKEREFHDIPVWVQSDKNTPAHSCGSSEYEWNYRPVPGGCSLQYGMPGACTIATPGYKFGSGRVLLGAGHCTYDWENGEDPETHGEGSTAYQPEYNASSPEIGEVIDVKYYDDANWDPAVDGAVIELNSYTDATSQMAGTSLTYDEDITGWIGIEAIKTKHEYNQSLYKQGRKYGRCSGEVTGYSETDNYVWISARSEGGDSGGPIFEKNGDQVNIAAVISEGGDGYTKGYMIDDFKERFNIDTIP